MSPLKTFCTKLTSRGMLAVVNSTCLSRLSAKRGDDLCKRIKGELGAEIRLTQYRGHAFEIAGQARDEEAFISVGGDGTTSEIINAMAGRQARLGIIPIGSGNCLMQDLGICSVDKAVESIKGGRVRAIDLVDVTYGFRGQEKKRCFYFYIFGQFLSQFFGEDTVFSDNGGGGTATQN